MTKSKTSTIFNIIGNGTRLYLQNIFILSAPVVMPVLGLFFGVALMILPVYLLPKFYPVWVETVPFLKEFWVALSVIILSLLPGFVVFKIAFWNYMLKVVSLNVMVSDIIKRKVVKHHSQYTKIVALRTKDYLLMLLIWLLIILMGLALPVSVFLFNIEPVFVPYFLVGFEFLAVFLLIILSIYLSLSFQVFAFETSFGPMQTLEQSFKLVLNNFWRIVTLMLALGIITAIVVPQIFVFISDILMIKNTLAIPFQGVLKSVLNNYPNFYDAMNSFVAISYESEQKFIFETSKLFSVSTISALISLLMLPLGSCYYTLFYFDAQKRHEPKETPEKEEQESQKSKSKKSKKK